MSVLTLLTLNIISFQYLVFIIRLSRINQQKRIKFKSNHLCTIMLQAITYEKTHFL